MSKDNRYRNFFSMVYVESASEDWMEKLRKLCIPAFVSPLHDRDVWDEDDTSPEKKYKKGDFKKPHWHIVLMFDGKKNVEQVVELLKPLNAVGCKNIVNLRSYVRYLCHLDDKDKVLYNIEDVISFGGADYYSIIDLPAERYQHLSEIMQFCVQNDIYCFSELSLYCMVHRKDWFRILVDKNTIFLREFLKSRQWQCRDPYYLSKVGDDGNMLACPVNIYSGEIHDD